MAQCMVTAPHHSNDIVEVWHGRATPAIACGYHATHHLPLVFNAHNQEN